MRKSGIIVVLIIAAAVGFSLVQIFRGVPLFGPKSSDAVLAEPKTIGIIYMRQQADAVKGLKEGMKEMGYTNVTYKEVEAFPPTTAVETPKTVKNFVETGVDLIYVTLENHTIPAMATLRSLGRTDIPVVFLSRFHDPVKIGLAKSFSNPGGNATGIAEDIVKLVQKHLEFIKKVTPTASKIGAFTEGFMVPDLGDIFLAELKIQAKKFGLTVVEYTTKVPPPEAEKTWHTTADKIKKGDIDAIYHIAGHFFDLQEVAEATLAARLGILHVAPPEDLLTGGHLAYSDDMVETGKQAARMMDKIFRGTDAGTIPIEFPKSELLTLQIARAKEAGIKFPDSLLFIAGKKIDR